MLFSMTGYNCATFFLDVGDGERISFSVELKSINARFLEVVCKLPSIFGHLEVKIISLLQKKLLRGRVYVVIKLGQESESFEPVKPCLKVVEGYLAAVDLIKAKHGIDGALSISDLLLLPHVFVSDKKDLDHEHEITILNAVQEVADKLMEVREQEGSGLCSDLKELLGTCQQKIKEVSKRFEELMKEKKNQIAQQNKLLESEIVDPGAKLHLDELYASLNKIDVHEEITRFNSHLQAVSIFIEEKKQDKGKRLDFILQELLRETNTIMAKCSDYTISAAAVDIKVALEKCREQAQNII